MSAEEISKAAEAKRACINSYPHWYEKSKDVGKTESVPSPRISAYTRPGRTFTASRTQTESDGPPESFVEGVGRVALGDFDTRVGCYPRIEITASWSELEGV